jgi:hypothetical protein
MGCGTFSAIVIMMLGVITNGFRVPLRQTSAPKNVTQRISLKVTQTESITPHFVCNSEVRTPKVDKH